MPDHLHVRRETRDLPLQLRFAPVSSVNREARTVDVIWTTGARVRRFDWRFDREYWEELALDPDAIDMTRLNSGKAPFLNSHERWDLRGVIGVVARTWVDNGQHLAQVRFSKRADVEPIFLDVQDGILGNVSVGYSIQRMEMIAPSGDEELWVYRATRWTPHELSLTPIGADPGAGTRSEQDERAGGRPYFPAEITIREESTMPQPNPDAGAAGPANTETIRSERGRAGEIYRRVRHAGLPQELGDRLVESGCSLDAACRQIVDAVAEAHPTPPTFGIRTEPNDGGPDVMARDFADVLFARCGGPQPGERAIRYAPMRMTDMARSILEAHGVSTRGLNRDELLTRAMHSTSDFPNILADVANKVLRKAYAIAPPGVKTIARQVNARDFKPLSRVQLSNAPNLEKVLEGGEFKRGKMSDAKETYSVETFGKIFGITRQALVNDDLGAFDQMGTDLGRQAAEFERAQLTALLTSNPTMGDGGSLFNATAVSFGGTGHANLGTGTGSALSVVSIGTAVKAMRLQKGLDATTPINATARYLIVPATLEATALSCVALITPGTASDVNPWAGRFEVIVDSRLDASSTTAWYLAADPAVIDTLEYAYLEDAPGPQILMQEGWDRDGVEWKVRLDFGCAAIDWRGLYKANGA